MAADFTVIIAVRQHFGNRAGSRPGAFVGNEKRYAFDCPNVDPDTWAVLMFETLDVDHELNAFEVNGHAIAGGIPKSPSRNAWNGNVVLINPNWLKEHGNELYIGSLNSEGTLSRDIDDFVMDNVVVLYKTK